MQACVQVERVRSRHEARASTAREAGPHGRDVMKRIGSFVALLCLLVAHVLAPTRVAAQDPDLREIMPYLMLVVDTSGSMERLVSSPCTSRGCTECLPKCDLPNDAGGIPPKSGPPENRELKKN